MDTEDGTIVQFVGARASREKLASALRTLVSAVAMELRHGDGEDEDRAWRVLKALSSALEKADAALVEYDSIQAFPPFDSEQVWDFWKGLVTLEDGTLNLEQVKLELFDFYVCMQEVTRVYAELTGGKFTSPTTSAEHILDVVAEQIQKEAEEQRGDLEKEINAAYERLKKAKEHQWNAAINLKMAIESYQRQAAYDEVEKYTHELSMAEIEVDRLRMIVQARKGQL